MSWDPQIKSIKDAGFKATIYAIDSGAVYTTDQLNMSPEQVKNACKAIAEGAGGVSKVAVGDELLMYMVLRNDEDCCYFKIKGNGGGCFGKTKTLLVAATREEGQQPGQLNELVSKVVTHLKSSGY